MRRRIFLLSSAASMLAWAHSTVAQMKQVVVIGVLHPGSREATEHRLVAFKEGLAALGWKEGTQVIFEERWADGRVDRLPVLAEELVAKKSAVIVTGGSAPVVAASKAAPNTPIVMATVGDPIAAGHVKSLARPGGMITGVTSIAGNITEKYLELLLSVRPKPQRVGFLFESTGVIAQAHIEAARRSSARLSAEVRFAEAARPEEIAPAISQLAREGAQALVIMPSSVFAADRRRIVGLAMAQRWPVVAQTQEYAEAGALLSYGADPSANYRRAAYHVDRILKGAKPGDLPIEQPTKFDLVINLKTAGAIGVTIPQELLLRADKVIE